ncbi:MAG: MarR family transcriptional regulator [Thermoplasmata archaeon]|nr:MarR family transcriptional regulator [Thermoplasmata archaeon]
MTARTPGQDSFEDVPLSALLRAAQRTYVEAVERVHADRGFDDLPPTGDYIIGAMNWSGASLEAVIAWMGVSKQAVSQAVDTLVARGYLQRTRDRADRRRVKLTLTPRGRWAGAAARAAVLGVDKVLDSRLGSGTILQTRAALSELIRMRRSGTTA